MWNGYSYLMITPRNGGGRCDSPVIPLECSALANIDLGRGRPNATETSGHVKIGLIDFKNNTKDFQKDQWSASWRVDFCGNR
jgi:hypothetical protein